MGWGPHDEISTLIRIDARDLVLSLSLSLSLSLCYLRIHQEGDCLKARKRHSSEPDHADTLIVDF